MKIGTTFRLVQWARLVLCLLIPIALGSQLVAVACPVDNPQSPAKILSTASPSLAILTHRGNQRIDSLKQRVAADTPFILPTSGAGRLDNGRQCFSAGGFIPRHYPAGLPRSGRSPPPQIS